MNERLFHLHIPKTGGTTLFKLLLNHFSWDRIALIVPEEAAPEVLADRIADAELVAGHLTWAAIHAFPQPPAVLTIVRDPIERTLSLYRSMRENAADGVLASPSQRLANEAATRSLNDMILDRSSPLRTVIGHAQVDFLSSPSVAYVAPDGEIDQQEIQRRLGIAVQNLEDCAWVATTETLDRDLQTLAARFRWQPFGIPERHMVTNRRADSVALTTRARRELLRLVESDRELHSRARAIADERHHLMVDYLIESCCPRRLV